jgi:NAD(P)-dependent dehydrogenase (short-subunit alcohol dehydrogenase family)
MSGRSGGAIVNISSVAGFMATHESPAYHAVKAGLIQLTRYLAVSAGPAGVRVNCVCPGFIVQDEHRARFDASDNAAYRKDAKAIHPLGQVGTADDVAQAVLFLSSPQASFVNGHVLVLDGGATLIEQFGLLRDSRRG